MTIVNQKVLSEHLGVSQAMITKYKKSGLLSGCYAPNSKKIILEKAVAKITQNRSYKFKYFELLKSLEKISATDTQA